MTEGGDATVREGIVPLTTDGNSVPPVVPVDDPLAPDAPIHYLLSIRHNPLVKNMTTEELTTLVQKLRTHATSPQTLSAKLKSDSDNVTTRRPRNAASTKRKALLDTL